MRQSLSAKCSTLVNVLNGVNSYSADVSVDVDLLTPANLSFHLVSCSQSIISLLVFSRSYRASEKAHFSTLAGDVLLPEHTFSSFN